MLYKISHIVDKSRRDSTLLTVGFNLRKKSNALQVPQGRHFIYSQVPSLRDLTWKIRLIRLFLLILIYYLGCFVIKSGKNEVLNCPTNPVSNSVACLIES